MNSKLNNLNINLNIFFNRAKVIILNIKKNKNNSSNNKWQKLKYKWSKNNKIKFSLKEHLKVN